MSSIRPIEANPRNAKPSHAPQSDKDKIRARKDILKPGLSGAGVVLPSEEPKAVSERRAQWHSSLKPWNVWEEWCAEQVVVLSIKIERCQDHENALRIGLVERASTTWDADRKLAIEILAEGLAKKPAKVARQLRACAHGCDWMIDRWTRLAEVWERKGAWTERQAALALDLLGTPTDFRDGPSRLDGDRPAVIAAEIADLTELRETVLADRDAHEQASAQLGLDSELAPQLIKARRYETECRRRLAWALAELQRGRRARLSPDQGLPPNPYANVAAPRIPVPAPAPEPAPASEQGAGSFEPASDQIMPFSVTPPTLHARR